MTTTAENRTATALRHRLLAVDVCNRAKAQYEIAVLDHVSAQIAETFPDTTHLTLAQNMRDRSVEVHALWTTHDGGTEELLLDVGEYRQLLAPRLDFAEIDDDLSDALEELDAAAWNAVRPEPRRGGHWALDLTPPDRAVRIAELVRRYYPEAELLDVDLSTSPCRVFGVVHVGDDMEDSSASGTWVPPVGRPPAWPKETERRIAALIEQIQLLPHLRAQHLLSAGGPTEYRALLPLPQPVPESPVGETGNDNTQGMS
ncbi:hypothetical protein OK074_2082 [Actinobacteria bacterium OK074]|nr:hypothetical protein OK074_2082 [Actinobacteria bacterium OK074]